MMTKIVMTAEQHAEEMGISLEEFLDYAQEQVDEQQKQEEARIAYENRLISELLDEGLGDDTDSDYYDDYSDDEYPTRSTLAHDDDDWDKASLEDILGSQDPDDPDYTGAWDNIDE